MGDTYSEKRGVGVSEMSFESVNVGNLRVHICSTDKFKTTLMVAMVQQELSAETVTRHALLPNVLQRGTRTHPSTVGLKRKLDDLYGATLFGDVFKRGERHILQLGLDLADSSFLTDADTLLEDGAAFLGELLYRPVTDGEAFREEYVRAEKKNLKQKIESLMDDKIRFAALRCVEEMCKGEPYALFNHGRLQDLDGINPQNLYTYYRELIRTRPIDLYFVGNLSVDRAVELVERHFSVETASRVELTPPQVKSVPGKVREVVDRLDVNQGKLNMGCRTGVTYADDNYAALLMFNGILGGFPHSKLFINVREKASLAYYAASRVESHKGILTVQSGIEIVNYQKAVDIIREQFDQMRQGKFTDSEISQTRVMLINQLKERQDRAFDLVDAHYHGIVGGKERPLDQMIREIRQVTREEITAVAQKTTLDTIYFLKDRKGGEGDGKN